MSDMTADHKISYWVSIYEFGIQSGLTGIKEWMRRTPGDETFMKRAVQRSAR